MTQTQTREELATSFKAVVGALARTDEERAKQLVVDLVASQLHGKVFSLLTLFSELKLKFTRI